MSASKHIGTDALTQGIPPVFCLILAVTEIAIQGTSLKELRSHVGTGHILQKSPSDPVYRLSNVPRTVDYAVNNLSIAAAVICLVAALVCFGNSLQRSQIQTSGKWIVLQLSATALATVLTLVSFIYACVQQSRSPVWQYTDWLSSGDWFTVESWACQMQHIIPDEPWLHETCRTSRSDRALATPEYELAST